LAGFDFPEVAQTNKFKEMERLNELTTEQKETMEAKVNDFLSGLNCENIDIPYMVDINNIDIESAYSSIYDMIEESNGFDVEIIYHSVAMEYLQENDCSLQESLGIAAEMGFTCDNLNSETLASILASQESRNDFSNLESEIETFFEELKQEIEELENIEE